MKNKIEKLTYSLVAFITALCALANPAYAQTDPTPQINAMVERIITIATQIGSGILILFIVKDAFDLLQNKDNPMVRNMIARDVFLLILAAVFLFKPDFILNAIRFIADA